MNVKNNKIVRPGVALLVVLFIVMAITILSLGFVARSDVELACGQNMLMKTQLDYLAESGLEHARGLILNPQDVNDPTYSYWRGGTGFQLASGTNDRYDVKVSRDPNDRCNYIIDCNSYRLNGTDTIGQSRVRATLRIDPCIAFWVGSNSIIPLQVAITGDVYCGGILTNNSSNIDGDAFATGMISGTITGRKNESVASEYPVAWPGFVSTDFASIYYIGSKSYNAEMPNDVNALAGEYGTSVTNRAGIWYCAGNANMPGGATINGTLVVNGDLTVSGASNVITAEPNFPALVVAGQVTMKNDSSLVINGLAQVGQQIMDDPNTTSAIISVIGGLFIADGGVISDKVSINITADPAIASIETWSAGNTSTRWSPASGAFFRSIERR